MEENNEKNEKIEMMNINKKNESIKENKINNNEKEKQKKFKNEQLYKINDNSDEKSKNILSSRSSLSLEGAKYPLSLYTRRVMNTSRINEYLNENSAHGVCGGKNLGNTCFMNSSIACISNCTELTYYFLCGDYKKDINEENENGMQGELAKKWGELLYKYWVQNTEVGNPQEFKYTIGQKAVRFKGYGQQDSNEFMNVFLDYLNEDLNSTTIKEYIELDEKKENESDEECSRRFWESNLKRNDSIITDLFCGQFKSTIVCPKCNWVSITFEPFYSLNLPIKRNKRKQNKQFIYKNLDEYQLFYVPKYGIRNTYKIEIKDIPNTTKIGECFDLVKNEENSRKINNANFLKINFKKYEGEVDEEDIIDENFQKIFAYELINEEVNDRKIQIYFIYNDKDGNIQTSQYPRMIVGKEDMSFEELRKNIYFLARKYILSPFIKYNENIDEVSQKINDYIKDMSIDDEYIFDIIEKEYNKIFNENPSEEELEQLQNFILDMPFKLTIREWLGDRIINIFHDNNLNAFSDEFKKVTKISSLKNTLEEISDDINNYGIVLEFISDSKYINQTNFKLNRFETKTIQFPKIEEEKEKEDEEEENLKQNIIGCIKDFCKEEQLKRENTWFCKKCKTNVLPKKKIDLYYLPKILIISFKRFIKQTANWEKNDEFINFPINNFNMKDLIIGPDKDHSIYDLFAVSQHYGDTGSGHYTAVCENGNNWYKYDDSSVSKTSPNAALSSAAYVLFYRRQTD